MMVVWILNLCTIGKASNHCVPISAALRQSACSLLGYDVWWALYVKEVAYWVFSSKRHRGHMSLLAAGHQGLAWGESCMLQVCSSTCLVACSSQTQETPHGNLPFVVRQHTLRTVHPGAFCFPEKGLDLLLLGNVLKCERKERLKGFVNHAFEIFHEPACVLGWWFSNWRLWPISKSWNQLEDCNWHFFKWQKIENYLSALHVGIK